MIFSVKELKGDNDYDESESDEEDLLIGMLTHPSNIKDQEFPPDNFEEFASDDDGASSSLIDHLVRLHKQSIKQTEAILKKEKELLVSFATAEGDDVEGYVDGLEALCGTRDATLKEIQSVIVEIKRN
jgi:hypothetical protein